MLPRRGACPYLGHPEKGGLSVFHLYILYIPADWKGSDWFPIREVGVQAVNMFYNRVTILAP